MRRIPTSRKRTFRNYFILVIIVAAIVFGGRAVFVANTKPVSHLAADTPARRNDVRRENLKLIAGALNRYMAEVGPLPIKIPATATPICAGSSANCKKAVRVDLMFLASAGYISAIPNDPVGGHDPWSTGYTASRDAAGHILLAAPRAEAGVTISLPVN